MIFFGEMPSPPWIIHSPSQVVLPFVDVVSDILTASAFFADGDVVWGSLTIAIVFVPFTIWAISIVYQFLMMGFEMEI